MIRLASILTFLLTFAVILGRQSAAWPQGKTSTPGKKLHDGVYAVQRDSLDKKDVLPLKHGESLVIHRHRYVKKEESEPDRFLIIRLADAVRLDLAGAPKAIKKDGEVVRILLKLRPKAAMSLERLTRDHLGRQITIIVGGDVVTTHTIRTRITGGEVQISNCAPGATAYLLEQLKAREVSK